MAGFEVKDSGKRATFDSGMVRDTEDGKTDYTLVLDGPMFERWAEHMTKGAVKYAERNWMKADGDEEYERFKKSALRHFLQWFRGDRDEDHAAAVFFNINGAEYVEEESMVAELEDPIMSSPFIDGILGMRNVGDPYRILHVDPLTDEIVDDVGEGNGTLSDRFAPYDQDLEGR